MQILKELFSMTTFPTRYATHLEVVINRAKYRACKPSSFVGVETHTRART